MKQTYTAEPPMEAVDEAARGERAERDPFLTAMGERVRMLRARRGMTRKTRASASLRGAQISARYVWS